MKFPEIIYFIHEIELHNKVEIRNRTDVIKLSLHELDELAEMLSVIYVAEAKIRRFKKSASVCLEGGQYDLAIQDLEYADALNSIRRKAKHILRENF